MKDPQEILKSYFGYPSFREGQEEIVNAILGGSDLLAVMRTSFGKSLCYQVPGLCSGGLTVVVTPLLSLMKSQVDDLAKLGVSADYLGSDKEANLEEQILRSCVDNELQFLYLSPEKLRRENVLNAITNSNVRQLVVDEAHCISLWGHNFRPEYRMLSSAFDTIKSAKDYKIPTAAFTATATEETRLDIAEQLSFAEGEYEIFTGSFDRPNIEIEMRQASNKLDQLISIFNQHQNVPTIVYTETIKDAEFLYRSFRSHIPNIGLYHGKLNSFERQDCQDKFQNNDYKIIFATKAFGMGVDKGDIRLVVNYQMPQDPEDFFQKIGRAGRDGEKSKAITLWSRDDRRLHEFFIDCSYPPINYINAVRHTLVSMAAASSDGDTVSMPYEQIAQYSPDLVQNHHVESSIRILEKFGVIALHNFDADQEYPVIEIVDPSARIDEQYLIDRRSIMMDSLNSMLKLCKTRLCRRRATLRHFGQKDHYKNCGNCDVCLRSSLEHHKTSGYIPQDTLSAILKLIKGVKRPLEARIKPLLQGVSNRALKRKGYDQLEGYGCLKDFDSNSIQKILDILVENNVLVIDSTKGVQLLPKGINHLKGSELLTITAPAYLDFRFDNKVNALKERASSQAKAESPAQSEHRKKSLEAVRKELSTELNKPVFMIFTETVLNKLVAANRELDEDLLKTAGIPEAKVKLFGHKIIEADRNYHLQNQEEELDFEP